MDEKLISQFWLYVDKGDGCWLWRGRKDKAGYGLLRHRNPINDRVSIKAHRFSWFLVNGPIPLDLIICHRCDTPGCVNPSHLFIGTHADNGVDRDSKGRGVLPPKPGIGSKNLSAKLTEQDVAKIRSQLRDGESSRSLALAYGVTRQCIGHILHGYTWKHVA